MVLERSQHLGHAVEVKDLAKLHERDGRPAVAKRPRDDQLVALDAGLLTGVDGDRIADRVPATATASRERRKALLRLVP